MKCTASISSRQQEAIFEELYEKAFPRVACLVKKRGRSLDDAQDIFQEAVNTRDMTGRKLKPISGAISF